MAKSKAVTKKKAQKKPVKKASPAPAAKSPLVVHEVYKIKLGDLLPDEGNPREIDKAELDRLIASVEEFGFVEPFVARAEDSRIVGGHQRALAIYKFLENNGVDDSAARDQEVTVVKVPGLSESRCRALNLALNKIGGDWDWARLPEYLAAIVQADLPLTGFGQSEIDDILALMSQPPEPAGGDPDTYLSDLALQFSFKVATAEEANLVRKVLAQYGMTGPKDAGPSFVRAIAAAEKTE